MILQIDYPICPVCKASMTLVTDARDATTWACMCKKPNMIMVAIQKPGKVEGTNERA